MGSGPSSSRRSGEARSLEGRPRNGSASERVGVEQPVDIAAPVPLIGAEQDLGGTLPPLDRLLQRGEVLALVLAFTVLARPPLEPRFGEAQDLTRNLAQGPSPEGCGKGKTRHGVAQVLPLGLSPVGEASPASTGDRP